ncbi:MAG: SH3 domain-containing protein [Lachnospiraceae bacterium]|nr:SH3 domain-containing protein [Lachnospiraceae bacterium]
MIRDGKEEREELEERKERRKKKVNHTGDRRKRSRKRRRKRNSQMAPAVIIVLLIFIVSGGLVGKLLYDKYSPSREQADTAEYFNLENDQEIAVLVNDMMLEDKGRLIDGRVYLNVETVYQYVNPRFYWDASENTYLYALPTELVSAQVGSSDYTVAKAKQSADYVILRADGNDVFVAIDFVNQYTNFTYEYWEDPNHVHIVDTFGEWNVVTAQKKVQVRYQAGIKSPILTTADKGSTMFVLEEEEEIEEWTRVLTKDGYIGYVRDKQISEMSKEMLEEPEFEEPIYTNIAKDHTVNLSWHQVTNKDANENIYRVLANTKGLTAVSPTWFFLSDNDGNIDSLADQDYVNYCHQNNVEVWALVEDITYKDTILDYEIFSRTTSRQRLVNNLIAQAIQYGLDGLNLDMEFINEDSARGYVQFIRELSIMCRLNGIILSVDNYVPAAYNRFYDRAEQGVFADYVIIMGYDETPRNSDTAGPVASIGFVESGIQNTLEEVPKEKVINAVPFYTRFWRTDENGEVTSEAMGMDSADQKAVNNNVEPVWDETTGQYYIELEYEGSIYQMWMEEERSIEEKLKLIKQYELAGVASWRLGYERAGIWDIILRYVN